jgi:hypothetical protein
MSKSSTAMIWPEPADDRLNVNHYQHPHDCRPPFEISPKARRILGLSVDGFHVNIPAVRLTTATPEHWPQQDGEVRREDRHERHEIHLTKVMNQRRLVEGSGQDGAGKAENEVEIQQQVKIQDNKQAQFELPSRHHHGKASLDAKPSKRYYTQPNVAEGIRQGRASLDSFTRPVEPSIPRQARASLDLPRQKPLQKPIASLDLPLKKHFSKIELLLPRPMSIAVNACQGRSSLDSPRQRPVIKIGPRSIRPVSFTTHKPGIKLKAGAPPNASLAATRRGKSNSFPNFSRPLSQVEPKSVPGDNIERARRSMERSAVRQGEVLRPKIVGVEDEMQQGITVTREIVIVGDEKFEQQPSLPRKKEAVKASNTQPDPTFSPTTEIRYVAQTPSIPNAPSPFNNTSMAVFPGDEDDKKPKSKPILSKIFTSLPLCLLRTGHRRILSESGTHSSRVGRGGAYSRYLLTEDNLRQLEEDVGSIPKMYALDHSLLPAPPLRTPERRNDELFLLPLLPNQGPLTPPISQHSSQARSAEGAVFATKTLPSLPVQTPPDTPFKGQEVTKPELPERMRISRIRQTCAVCKETRHIAHYSTWAPTTRCKHPSQTCVPCMQKWIATCIETKGWDSCMCPECSEPLAYDDVKLFATQEVFAR